ncbi:hypothetical protein CVT25_000611 [Psilocybe cyanescens]|uniref:DUF6534 domain-containing protein n=1 Tax=Psilocybe cyanescens TaxID=93625 RepID=A0A409XUI7_PSICY|nr:hypothetical protein CVT25_000611 [Psilocybe cyanescens]
MAFFDLNDTFGAYTLGTFASSILFGTYHYFNTYSDGILLKLTVITVSCFEMLHVSFSIHAVYHYLVNDYFSPLSLLHNICRCFEMLHVSFSIHAVYHYLVNDYFSPLSLLHNIWYIVFLASFYSPRSPEPWLAGPSTYVETFRPVPLLHNPDSDDAIVVLVVHLFYARRIYIISRRENVLIPVAITIASLANCTTNWILVAVLFRLHSLLELPGLPETLAKMSLSTTVAIDITIAATLTYYLHTSRTGIKQVFDIITLTLITTRPRDLLFLAFSQVLATLYSNSFLATLNSRRRLEKVDAVVSSNALTLQTINFRAAAAGAVNSDSTSSPIEILQIQHMTINDLKTLPSHLQTIARKPNILAKPKERQVRKTAPRVQIPSPALAAGDLERDDLPAFPAPAGGGGVSEGRRNVEPGVTTPGVARHEGLKAGGAGDVANVKARSGVGLFV